MSEQKWPAAVEAKLKNLPTQPGVYLYRNENDKVIYVGKAKNLRNRVRSYFQSSRNHDPKTRRLVKRIRRIETILVDSEVEALILEANLIKEHRPRYNVFLKDDKSYPYIRITKEPFPQVFVTRRIIKDGSKYLGPYTDVKQLRHIMRTLTKIFPVRSCKYLLNESVIAAGKAAGGDMGALVHSLLRAAWAEEKDIAEDAVINECLKAAGFDPSLSFTGMLSGAEAYAANLEEAQARGVFGSPFYITDGDERFWGQDRLEDLDLHLSGKL